MWEPTPRAYVERGLFPIALWGLSTREDGTRVCLCPKGAKCGHSSGKHPLRPGWQRQGTPDLSPEGNVGLRMGRGIIAIDLDGPRELLAALEARLGPLPPTMTSRTGSGGTHLLYRVPEGARIRNSASKLAPHVDVRSEGGQIVAPPSLHLSGSRYEWIDQREPATLPEAWLRELEEHEEEGAPAPVAPATTLPEDAHRRYGELSLRSSEREVSTAPEGARNNTLNREAYCQGGNVAAGLVDERVVRERLLGAAMANHWTREEALPVLERGLAAGMARPRARHRARTGPRLVRSEEAPAAPAPVVSLVTGQAFDASWMAALQRSGKGALLASQTNVELYLRHHADWSGVLAYDAFAGRLTARAPVPGSPHSGEPRGWTDEDDAAAIGWLERQGLHVAEATVRRAIGLVARDQQWHPVRAYLDGLTWDGTPRLSSWLTSAFGAPATPYTAQVGACWLVSAVARVMVPGAKVDHVLVLQGCQGARKSTALNSLAGDDWFTDHLAPIGDKDAVQQLRGVWIVELAELANTRRAEIEAVKAFLTTRRDRIRLPFGHHVSEWPRQCVFAATVNPGEFLHDDTGGRRFWPVSVVAVDLEWVRQWRDQLWAEALGWYLDGKPWWLDDPGEAAAREEQEARREDDPWEALVARFLTGYDEVTADMLYVQLKLEPREIDQRVSRRVATCLRLAGWEWQQIRRNGSRVRVWRPAGTPPPTAE